MTVSEWQKATHTADGNDVLLVHVDHVFRHGWERAMPEVSYLDEYFEIGEVVQDVDSGCWIVRLGGIV